MNVLRNFQGDRPQRWSRCGSALMAVLLVMAAISVLGIMSLNRSVVELRIARNEKEARESFYLSESAAIEGIQRLMDTPQTSLEDKFHFWHHTREEIKANNIDFRDPEAWDVDGREEDNGLRGAMEKATYMAAVEWELATGSSALVTGPRLYLNRVYGLCTKYNTHHLVEIGFYMRY